MNNLFLWIAQATALIATAALLARALKSIPPAARLAFWQLTLAAAILLPALQPWQSEAVTAIRIAPQHQTIPVAVVPVAAPVQLPSLEVMLTALLALGILIKLVFLAAGLYKLRQYRLRAQPYPYASNDALILISEDVSSPVTFGFLAPVVLVPTEFAALPADLRAPILSHELIHVRRKDWLFALAEEIVRSLFWFHPAIWYATREIQLAREETVDREVVSASARQTYVDALLAIANIIKGSEMATAPFFLRRKHLKRRVFSLFHEVTMSKPKTATAFLAACAAMALSCWFVTGALPLKAAPQEVIDGGGVSVELNGARLMHRSAVSYPAAAFNKRVQGTVTAQVRLDSKGNVVDASITGGPDELRKSVLQSVLGWHFTSDSANATRQVSVTFTAPTEAAVAVIPKDFPAPVNPNAPTRVGKIVGPADLIHSLPIHEGDTMTPELAQATQKAARDYDEHLNVSNLYTNDGLTVGIMAPGEKFPGSPAPRPDFVKPDAATPSKGIHVGPNVQAANLIAKVDPAYPPLAKAARVQGDVVLETTIGTDGKVQNLHLISGPPLLVAASIQAVQQWQYKPTLLNGQPVEVVTNVTVTFTLNDN